MDVWLTKKVVRMMYCVFMPLDGEGNVKGRKSHRTRIHSRQEDNGRLAMSEIVDS
jgi:exoribonuclease R